MYGVDFNRLMNVIKKNSDHTQWTPADTQLSLDACSNIESNSNQAAVAKIKSKAPNKFELSMKTFQMHQRKKHERLSRRSILLMETRKFQESIE